MNRPAFYHQYNELERCISKKVLDKYAQKMHWHHDGLDTLIDVGTGTGNVLMELIRPEVPPRFKRIVGCDISAEAITFAQEYYKSQRKCQFQVLDIGMDQELPNDLKGQFDHVTSFNCLHWVHNQEQALKNIYDLIRPEGGYCLLSFAAYLPVFDIYEALRDTPTWAPYIGHIDYFTGPLQRIEKEPLAKLIESLGFQDVRVETTYEVHDYDSAKIFKDHMAASSLFLKYIPPSMHETMMVDFLEVARRLGCRASSPCGTICKYSLNFTNAVVFARKLPQRV